MKKIISFAFSIFLYSQVYGQSSLTIGAGISINQISAIDNTLSVNDIAKLKSSPYLDLKYNYQFADQWELSSGFLYHQKGFTVDESTGIGIWGINIPIAVKAKTNVHYVDIPIELKYHIGTEKLGFYGMIGPVLNVGISGRIRPVANVLIDFNLPDIPIHFGSDGFSRIGISAKLGAGILLGMDNGDNVGLNLAYQKGYTNTYQAPIVALGLRNRHFSAGLSYRKRF